MHFIRENNWQMIMEIVVNRLWEAWLWSNWIKYPSKQHIPLHRVDADNRHIKWCNRMLLRMVDLIVILTKNSHIHTHTHTQSISPNSILIVYKYIISITILLYRCISGYVSRLWSEFSTYKFMVVSFPFAEILVHVFFSMYWCQCFRFFMCCW